jgi:hypothetical protein
MNDPCKITNHRSGEIKFGDENDTKGADAMSFTKF